jgi:hypothetical protein
MPFSITYIFVAILTYLGIENAQEVADAIIVLVVALGALYGRYRAGGVNIIGWRKK